MSGIYDYTFTPTIAGKTPVSIKLNGADLGGSSSDDKTVTVIPADPSASKITYSTPAVNVSVTSSRLVVDRH